MDLFLMHGDTDDLSLHDMIKQDMREDYGRNYTEDFSSEFALGPLDSDVLMSGFEPLFDLDGVIAMDDLMSVSSMSSTPAASTTSSVCSSASSNGDCDAVEQMNEVSWIGPCNPNKDTTFDIESAVFVDPSVVLPSTLASSSSASRVAISTTQSPMLGSIPTSMSTEASTGGATKSEVTAMSVSSALSSVSAQNNTPTQFTVVRPVSSTPTIITTTRQLSNSSSQGGNNLLTSHHHTAPHRVQISSNTILNNRVGQNIVSQSGNISRIGSLVTSSVNNSTHLFRGKPTANSRNVPVRRSSADDRTLPKPAYSYSCLIALALKNSTTGSLPVSEIYSFMCEHFPYFRTAPNGWKNSVRHNLSLNKCFEKIEKPVVSGNNQRKGCLWALNPNKAHKMDEEIQKWSKKDLQGIKDAMNSPDVLPALERGEMKFESSLSTSSCSEDEEEDEIEVDPLTLWPSTPSSSDTTTPTTTKLKLNNTIRANNMIVNRNNSTHLQIHKNRNISTGIIGSLTPGTILSTNKLMRSSNSYSSCITPPQDAADCLLPDSTMTEISLPTNGTVLDDLGNEISIEEEEIVSNSSIVSGATHSRNFLLKKYPLSRTSNTNIRGNFVYTAPTLNSPHHHNTVNRLVLTNAKMA